MTPKILIACEESQRVCAEFRRLGAEAYSCDILECSGGHPEWHIRGDVLKVINGDCVFVTEDDDIHVIHGSWDAIIAHPPCTYLCVTGNRWFNKERYGDKALEREIMRTAAIDFFMNIVNANCDRICIENPVGIMSGVWRKPNQIIQPYMFGDPYEKKTCLWVKGLPNLNSTNIVKPEKRVSFGSGKSMPKWYAEAWKLPKDERARLRSKTFPGIAKAMAEQWYPVIFVDKIYKDARECAQRHWKQEAR